MGANAGLLQAALIGRSVRADRLQPEHIRPARDPLHHEVAVARQRLNHLLARRRRARHPFAEALQILQRDGRKRPRRGQSAAEHPARMIQIGQQRLRPGQHRAARRVEVLVHRDVDRIEQRGVLLHTAPRVGALHIEARAIQMPADLALRRPGGDLLHLVKIKALARLAPDWAFDHDGGNRRHHAARLGTVRGGLGVLQ